MEKESLLDLGEENTGVCLFWNLSVNMNCGTFTTAAGHSRHQVATGALLNSWKSIPRLQREHAGKNS